MPLPRRRTAIATVLYFAGAFASSAAAQTRNPYYELQCSMTGAYCDRVYAPSTRPENFDEFQERKARERAQRAQERAAREALDQARRAQERADREARAEAAREQVRLAREEQEHQARILAEQAQQQRLQRIASAPLLVHWFHAVAPRLQWAIAGLLAAFGAIAYVGRSAFSIPRRVQFFPLGGAAILTLPFTASAAGSGSPWFALLFALTPALLFLALNALHFLRGWHHLFVSHPATSVAGPPLRDEVLFPRQELAAALKPDPAQLFDHPPAYKSRDLAQKAHALREKIDADADIAAAAMRRDRARAAKMQAEAELRALRKSLPWWRRWFR